MMVNFIKKGPKKGTKQKGYTTERCMPGNAVTMLLFQIKRSNLSPKNKNCRFFFLCFKMPKTWVCRTTINEGKKGGWPLNIGIKFPQSIKV